MQVLLAVIGAVSCCSSERGRHLVGVVSVAEVVATGGRIASGTRVVGEVQGLSGYLSSDFFLVGGGKAVQVWVMGTCPCDGQALSVDTSGIRDGDIVVVTARAGESGVVCAESLEPATP